MSSSPIIRRVAPKTSQPQPSGGKWKWIFSIALLLALAAGAWAFLPSEDPGLTRIEQLRAQMDGANDQQRRDLFRQMHDEFEKLSPEAREQAFDGWRRRWQQREQEHLNKFFSLSPAEQIAQIDKDLKRDAERRKQWQRRRARTTAMAEAGPTEAAVAAVPGARAIPAIRMPAARATWTTRARNSGPCAANTTACASSAASNWA